MTKKIGNILNIDNLRLEKEKQGYENKKDSIDKNTISIVNELFLRFSAIYPSFRNTFKSTEDLNATKKQWMKGFIVGNINTGEQLERGLNKCLLEERDFFPTIGKFVKWCTFEPFELGVPSLDEAYEQACKNSHPSSTKEWTHKLVRHAWKLTGSYFLSTSLRSVSYPVFQRNYEITLREWRAGKIIDEIAIPKGLTKPEKKSNPELAKKNISECLAKLRGK